MSNILYEDPRLRITDRTLEKGPTSYPLSKIVSVMQPLQLPMSIVGGILLNSVVLVVGLLMIFSFTAIWSTIGVLLALMGFINVKSQFNRPWWITVELANGEELKLERTNKDEIERIYDALRTAIENH
jgi:hypothetical protein